MSEHIRYGVIGTGMMGREHITNLQGLPGADIVAIADPDAGSRTAATETIANPDLAVFDSHRSLLADGGCDAVVVATPNHTHADVMLDVLAAGIHVMVEKPLAISVGECRRIIEAAEDHPGVVWVGLEYRYMPAIAQLLDEVHSGTVGTVEMVAIREHRFPFLEKVGNWNRFNRNTGGTLVEKCCHFFDLMNLIAESDPLRVYASGGQDVNHLDEVYDGEPSDILDNAFVVVEYASGVRAMLDLCMFAEVSKYQGEVSVVGARGKVEALTPGPWPFPGRGEQRLRIGDRSAGVVSEREPSDDRIRVEGEHHGSSFLEHVGFRDAILTGGEPEVTLVDGLQSVALGVAAHRSIDEGRVVEMREVLG